MSNRGSPEQGLAIEGVTVVDPATGSRRADQVIVITGGRIAEVGERARIRVPRGLRRIRGEGYFLIPGLWDMHVHLSMAGRDVFPALLAAGVTSVRDMGGDPVVLAWRDSVRQGRLEGPVIVAAGLIVESKAWVDAVLALSAGTAADSAMRLEMSRRLAIATRDEARHAVDSLARLGADMVKIRNYASPDAVFALFGEARRRGLPVVGHSPPPVSWVPILADSGMHTFEHQFLSRGATGLIDGVAALGDSARASLWQRLVARDVSWTPTLVTQRALGLPDSAIMDLLRTAPGGRAAGPPIPPRLRAEWQAGLALRRANPDAQTNWEELFRQECAMVRSAQAHGVRLLVGSDMGVAGVVPGLAVHEELEHLVACGVPVMTALRGATSEAATSAGRGGVQGRVAPGYAADLVLLAADPTVDVRATREVVAVIRGGVVIGKAP